MQSKPRNQAVSVPINETFHHDLSHNHVTTMDFFRLQPVLCQECIPGGSYSIDLRAVVSAAPLATQVYGGCHMDLHAFFVPNRIIYEEWNEYFAGNSRITGSSSYIPLSLPHFILGQLQITMGWRPETLTYEGDYRHKEMRRVMGSLGYPSNCLAFSENPNYRVSALQWRAYEKIWWDYYRDSVNIPEENRSSYLNTAGGSETMTPFCRYRTFIKDPITTLLANPQLGDPGHADGSMSTIRLGPSGVNVGNVFTDGNRFFGSSNLGTVTNSSSPQLAPSVSAIALRGALAMQRYLERLNVTGTRPMERLLSLLGAKPSPERLDMAEFLGGKTIRINIDGLRNTGSADFVQSDTSSQGGLNAWGVLNEQGTFGQHVGQGYQTGSMVGSGQTDKINYNCTEHGFIMVIASIIPEYGNPNHLQRQFIRGLSTPNADRFDFFTPDFDGLGYQECLLAEVATPMAQDAYYDFQWDSDFNAYNVVGYEPKYEDYRKALNRISGDFNEGDSSTAMRQLCFTLAYPEVYNPAEVEAGLKLTTSSFAFRELFDKHFQIPDSSLDHFIVYLSNVIDANLPVTGNQLPTELSDLANSQTLDVSNGGVRL